MSITGIKFTDEEKVKYFDLLFDHAKSSYSKLLEDRYPQESRIRRTARAELMIDRWMIDCHPENEFRTSWIPIDSVLDDLKIA